MAEAKERIGVLTKIFNVLIIHINEVATDCLIGQVEKAPGKTKKDIKK
jgi:hypothetical protein